VTLTLIEDNGHYRPAEYILSMGCVSGDEIQVAIHRQVDIVHWLKTLDHEGSSWSVTRHQWNEAGDHIHATTDITDEITRQYEAA
jgi:hypothetical protein